MIKNIIIALLIACLIAIFARCGVDEEATSNVVQSSGDEPIELEEVTEEELVTSEETTEEYYEPYEDQLADPDREYYTLDGKDLDHSEYYTLNENDETLNTIVTLDDYLQMYRRISENAIVRYKYVMSKLDFANEMFDKSGMTEYANTWTTSLYGNIADQEIYLKRDFGPDLSIDIPPEMKPEMVDTLIRLRHSLISDLSG